MPRLAFASLRFDEILFRLFFFLSCGCFCSFPKGEGGERVTWSRMSQQVVSGQRRGKRRAGRGGRGGRGGGQEGGGWRSSWRAEKGQQRQREDRRDRQSER